MNRIKVTYVEPDLKIIVPQTGGGKEVTTEQKGWNIFPVANPFVLIYGKRRSGKTVLMMNLLSKMTSKNDRLIIFSSTFEVDKTWRLIEKILNSNGVQYTNLDRLIGRDPLTGIDVDNVNLLFDILNKRSENGMKKSRTFIVLDDIDRKQLRSQAMNRLSKVARHFEITILCASQYPLDLQPESRQQVDFCILFPKISKKNILALRNDFDIDIPEEEFYAIYRSVTSQDHNFLYIQRNPLRFRRNLDSHLHINVPEAEDE